MLLAIAEGELPITEGVSACFYRDQFLYALGLKVLMFDRAKGLEVLKAAQSDKAKEKWLRESYKDGNENSVKQTLEEIIDNPQSDTLLAFAEDFRYASQC